MLRNFSFVSLLIGFASLISALVGGFFLNLTGSVIGLLALLAMVFFGLVLVALGLLGLFQKPDSVKSAPSDGAFEAVTPQRLRWLMGKGGNINWLDREVVFPETLRKQPRLLIRGPRRVGKTREAVELIRRSVDRGLVKKNRVYWPRPAFRVLDADSLRKEIEKLVDSLDPLLIFLDDLPQHYDGELLDRVSQALHLLGSTCEVYVVATGRPEDLEEGHLEWLQLQNFALVDLPSLSAEGQGRLIDSAAGSFNLQVSEKARRALIEHGDGTPELPILKLRQLSVGGTIQVDRKMAAEVGPLGLSESWQQVKHYISRQNEDASTILDALATFHAGQVTPYQSLLMDYARVLAYGRNGSSAPTNGRKGSLESGLAYLQNFDVIVDRDLFFYPSLIAEDRVDQKTARKNLIAFIKRENQQAARHVNGSVPPGMKYLNVALFDLTHTATDPDEKLELFSQTLKGSPNSGFYYERGTLYFERKDYEKAIEDYNEVLRLKPDHPSALYQRGTALVLTGRTEAALKDFDQAIRLRPDFGPAILRRGNLYFKNGEFERALQDFDYVINQDPSNTRLRHQRGLALFELQQFDRALEDFESVLEQEPENTAVRQRCAEVYLKTGDFDRAIDDLNTVIRQRPGEAETYYQRALAYSKHGDTEMALADFNRVLSIHPDHALSLHKRGQAYYANGRLDLAIDDFEDAIRLQPTEARSFYELGSAYAQKGRTDRAIACYSETIRLQPDHINAYYDRGTAYYKQGDFSKTIADLDAVVQMRPDDPSVFNNRGLAFCKHRDYSKAVDDFNQAIRIRSDDASLFKNRGRAYLLMGDFVRAIEDYEQAIRLNPKDATSYAVRALVYANRGDYERAIPDYDAALRLKPQDAAMWVNRGNAYAELGSLNEAIADYDQAVKTQPQFEPAYSKRGQAYARLNDLDSAIENYNRAILIKPDNASTLVFRGQAYLLRKSPKKALADFSRAVQIDSTNSWAMYLQGLAFLKTGQVQQGQMSLQLALQFAEEKYAADPLKWWNSFNYGLYLLALDKVQNARGIYIDVIAKEPPKNIVRGAIKDVENFASLFPEKEEVRNILDMLRRHG